MTTIEKTELAGMRILVVEDQFLVADELAEILMEWGCVVLGPAMNVANALEIVQSDTLDAAVLDINLGDKELSFPIAVALEQQDVPFVFLTGYDFGSAFPPEYASVLRLKKPLQPERLWEALVRFA